MTDTETGTVTIDLGDGTTVAAEVIGELRFQESDDAYGDVDFRTRAAARTGEAVALTLDQVRDTVRNLGRWAAETVTGPAAGDPDACEVEFGLKLAVKSGRLMGIVAEAGSEAGLTVRLSWDLASRRASAGTGRSEGQER
ncbi:CU044_2847 family protein [Streptomyces odontomachi]|uniref:CU044_2847 family protein n=1 Tax=Streptomyces odontomachi TaxID=2944940 RepID=UPI002109BA84|nr:CU044_2847 family protein [Streptomyces sp. ODS25]